jgi:hypothetical protein
MHCNYLYYKNNNLHLFTPDMYNQVFQPVISYKIYLKVHAVL